MIRDLCRRQANQDEERLIAMALMVRLFIAVYSTFTALWTSFSLSEQYVWLTGAKASAPWVRGRMTPSPCARVQRAEEEVLMQ